VLTHSDSIDKTGVKAKKYLVTPLLQYLKPLLTTYIKKNTNLMKKINIKECEKMLDDIKIASEIIMKIDDNTLVEEVSKYIAPQLHLNNTLVKE